MSYVVTGNISTVKGLGDDPRRELDLDVIQTAIISILSRMANIGVMKISAELEKLKMFHGDAVIYSVLYKLEALGIAAKQIQPVNIDSTKFTKIDWRLSDRFLNIMKDSQHV